MTINIRYLSEDEIEKEAELLLAEYTETSGAPINASADDDLRTGQRRDRRGRRCVV
jgi:hypothetical protein